MERARAGSKPVDVPVQLVSAESEGRRQIEFQGKSVGRVCSDCKRELR